MREAPPGTFYVPSTEVRNHDSDDTRGIPLDLVAAYAPGTVVEEMNSGQAHLIQASSDIVFELHYTANGKAGDDKAKLGLIFAKEPPKERVLTLNTVNMAFAIPPGEPDYRVDAKITLQEDSTLLSFFPHMHFRGKDFEYAIRYPGGRTETVLSVPHYNFNWQLTYDLAKPKFLPKGTIVECTAHFDNSPNNPFNPDPSKTVHWGDQTWEEMMIGFFDVAVPPQVGQLDLMVPKKEKTASARNSSGK